MGVHGLTTFISSYHEKYKEKIYIRSGPVVIDGSNLMYFLYFDGRSSVVERGPRKLEGNSQKKTLPHAYLFGGDWELYAQNVRYFFQQLKQCNITPIVILDGAYDSSKLEVAKRRFQETINNNVKPDFGDEVSTPGKTYTPIFLKTVFLEVLSEQKVIHYQSIGEADPTIAFIAKLLKNCPILSCDSDFYIYINAKVVPLGSLKFAKAMPNKKNQKSEADAATPSSKVWTLQGERVSLPKLCKNEFKLHNPRLLPLAAVILGNDTVERSFSMRFLPSRAKGKGSLKMNIAGVLKWLADQPSLESAIQFLTDTVPPKYQETVKQILLHNVAIYEGESGELGVWERLKMDNNDIVDFIDQAISEKIDLKAIDNRLQNVDITSKCDEEEESSQTATLPSWYEDGHIRCRFQTYLLNIHQNQVVFLTPQIEMYETVSSHQFSIPIIQVTAGILMGSSDENAAIELVTHHKRQLVGQRVDPILELKDFGNLPKFSMSQEISQSLSHEKRLELITTALNLDNQGVEFAKAWPQSYRIWMATLVYYCKCKLSSKAISMYECLSIMTSIFLCVIKNLIVNPSPGGKRDENTKTIIGLMNAIHDKTYRDASNLQKIRKFYQKFEDFFNVTSKKFLKNYDIRLANALSEYECILFHTEMLNNLLGNALKPPKVRYTLNNFFVYNLSRHIISEIEKRLDEPDQVKDFIADVTGVDEVKSLLYEFLNICNAS